jgi:hypothetical protein
LKVRELGKTRPSTPEALINHTALALKTAQAYAADNSVLDGMAGALAAALSQTLADRKKVGPKTLKAAQNAAALLETVAKKTNYSPGDFREGPSPGAGVHGAAYTAKRVVARAVAEREAFRPSSVNIAQLLSRLGVDRGTPAVEVLQAALDKLSNRDEILRVLDHVEPKLDGGVLVYSSSISHMREGDAAWADAMQQHTLNLRATPDPKAALFPQPVPVPHQRGKLDEVIEHLMFVVARAEDNTPRVYDFNLSPVVAYPGDSANEVKRRWLIGGPRPTAKT